MNGKEEEDRYELILKLISARYQLEWQRMTELNSKAGNLISFDGVIISILALFASIIQIDITNQVSYIFLASITLLIISIFCGLRVYFLDNNVPYLNVRVVIGIYSNLNLSKIDALKALSEAFAVAIDGYKPTDNEISKLKELNKNIARETPEFKELNKNIARKPPGLKKSNDAKARWIFYGLICLIVGLTAEFLFIIFLLIWR